MPVPHDPPALKLKVVIVGAGTVGLSQALRIKESFGDMAAVTVVAENFLANTTSFGSGGLWEPYQIAGTPEDRVNQWGKVAFDHYLALLRGPDAARAGVQLLTAYQLYTAGEDPTPPSWKDIVFNFRSLGPSDLAHLGFPSQFTHGYTFGTLVIDQSYYMPYLTSLLKSKWNVTFRQEKVDSLERFLVTEGTAYNVVVNCTGLGAGRLLGKPDDVYPIRGQVLRVKAPWMNSVVFWGTSYIIPNVDTVVLGGTAQKGSYDTTVSDADTKRIMDDVCGLFPAMREANIERIWAGLRPGRTPLRIESETRSNRLVVHNYGHGGSGITLAMGCADEVVAKHILPFAALRAGQSAVVLPSKL
jgi:D-amino-acid oxidase